MLITQGAVLSAALESMDKYGSSGSALVTEKNGVRISEKLTGYDYMKPRAGTKDMLIETAFTGKNHDSYFQQIRPLKKGDDWFENVWNAYVERTGEVFDEKK